MFTAMIPPCIRPWGLSLLLFTVVSCGPTVPDEVTLRQRLQGVYCDGDYRYRLELRDSTYFNRRVFNSPLGIGRAYESCQGRYSLAFQDTQWVIRFDKDPKPRAIENCHGELVIWHEEEGYLHGNAEQVMLPDCFDGQLLVKGPCQ